MSKEPKFMKVEMRPFAWVPFCFDCGEPRALKENKVITDAQARPKFEIWTCPKCKDEAELPPGFPHLRHEAVTVENFELPTLEGEEKPT